MIVWALVNEHGIVESAGVSKSPPAGYIPFPAGLTPEYASFLMRVEGEWVERPSLQFPVTTSVGFSIAECPDGVICRVYDKETSAYLGEVISEGGALVVELPDPGEYQFQFSVPDPFVEPEPFTLTIQEI